jgi:MoaA/NifB/PqqE/SkfB family radical SAM enzyme
MGGRVVVLAGEGEPVLDEYFCEIVQYINKLGMITILYSNGSTLTPEVAKFCRRNNVCLVIALDSLRPDIHQILAGTKYPTLPRVLNNLSRLRKIYADTVEEYGDLRVVRLAINMTLCGRNRNEIQAIKSLADNDMYFVCNPMASWGNSGDNWLNLMGPDADPSEYQRLISEYSESGGPLTLDSMGVCGYSHNGIAVSPSGQFMPCAYTNETDGLLGTIHNRSLSEAFTLKQQVERAHYQKYGPSPCLVRSEAFCEFVQALRAQT